MNPTTLLWCATLMAACASVSQPTAAEADRIAAARAALDQDPDRAIELAERLLADNPDLREARLVKAEGSMRIAQNGGASANLHWLDAAKDFDEALTDVEDAKAPGALLMLARCRHALGEYEIASAIAQRAAAAFTELDVPDARRAAAEARLLAGRCEMARFVEARDIERKEGEPDSRGIVPVHANTRALANAAGAHFAAARREFPADATLQTALLYRWLDETNAAVQELERGLRLAPAENRLHDAFIEWMRDNGQWDALLGFYSRFVREQPTNALLRWHHGRAMYERAFAYRKDGDFARALAGFEKADAAFAEYADSVRSHAADANQWRALCRVAIAQEATDSGKLDVASASLLLAAQLSPTIADGVAGDTGLFVRTMFSLHKALADSGDNALQRTLAFNEEMLRRYPDRWGFVYNNAALAARDLGVQKAKAGDDRAAMELWERSHDHYTKAAALSPDDARTLNDCAVMLIYHLHRDLDRARRLCDRAIELGKQKLAALPEGTPRSDREAVEEAIGDAYQNLAVMMRELQKQPFDAYRPLCEEAVKYYPYQRREAAALLREQGAGNLGSAARTAGGGSAAQQGSAAEAFGKQAAAIDAKVAADDIDGALVILDGLAKDCRDYAPYHRKRGELTMQLAKQPDRARQRGLLMEDAVTALKRAVELDPEPAAPRQLLAEATYETGDVAGAADQASSLLLHLQSQGGGKPEELLAAHTLRANAASRAFIAKKQANENDQDLLTAARASFRMLEEKEKLDFATRQLWSSMEGWAGAGAEATNVWVRALAKTPNDEQLLGTLLATAYDQSQLALAAEALEKRTDATGLFYLGEARFWFASAERKQGKNDNAMKLLDAARDSFAASMQKNPQFKAECEKRVAKCLAKKGAIALTADDAANAEKWLLEAIKLRPDGLLEDLGDQETPKRAVMLLVDKHMKRDDLGKAIAIMRAVTDVAKDDGDLLNNTGLFARDYGVVLERSGKTKEAQDMYEASYQAYRRAQRLEPSSVRLRNDCALMVLYHVDKDWELVLGWLEGGIADGEKTLRDNPPEDRNDREVLEEAVGDCYENLALYHLNRTKDAAAAKAAAEKSQTFHPGGRRPGARRHLAAAERMLQGK